MDQQQLHNYSDSNTVRLRSPVLSLVKVNSRYWPRTFRILSLGTLKIDCPAQFDELDWQILARAGKCTLQRNEIFD